MKRRTLAFAVAFWVAALSFIVIDWTRATKYFLLMDFIKGFGLGMKYFFAPKSTLNYPHEKGPLSPRFRGLMGGETDFAGFALFRPRLRRSIDPCRGSSFSGH